MLTPEQKQKWLEMLRSGNYQQAHTMLKKNTTTYCCLGLFILSVEGDKAFRLNKHNEWQIEGRVCCLPDKHKEMIGCDTDTGNIRKLKKEQIEKLDVITKKYEYKYKLYGNCPLFPEDKVLSLSGLNDNGVPFVVIADVIEALF